MEETPELRLVARVASRRTTHPIGHHIFEADDNNKFVFGPNRAFDKIYCHTDANGGKVYTPVLSFFTDDVPDLPPNLWDYKIIWTRSDPNLRINSGSDPMIPVANAMVPPVKEEPMTPEQIAQAKKELKHTKNLCAITDPVSKITYYPVTVYTDLYTADLISKCKVSPYVEDDRISCDPEKRRVLGFYIWPFDGMDIETEKDRLAWEFFQSQLQAYLAYVITSVADLRYMYVQALAKRDNQRNEGRKPNVAEFLLPTAEFSEHGNPQVTITFVEDVLFGKDEETKEMEAKRKALLADYKVTPMENYHLSITAAAALAARMHVITGSLTEEEYREFDAALALYSTEGHREKSYMGLVFDGCLAEDAESMRLAQEYGEALQEYESREENCTQEETDKLFTKAKECYIKLKNYNKNVTETPRMAAMRELAAIYVRPESLNEMRVLKDIHEMQGTESFTRAVVKPLLPALDHIKTLRLSGQTEDSGS